MRVLVTGSNGLLGSAITAFFRHSGDDVHAADHAALDIVDLVAVRRLIERLAPDAIINCAAYNDVDGAEEDPQTALNVNALGVRGMARVARETGVTFIHYSSDFVFDGKATHPYTEEDAPNPQSVYAASKLLGEWFAADAARHYVLRVESLFGPAASGGSTRRGSLGTIVDRIRDGAEVAVFVDRTVSPSFTPDIARATRLLIEKNAPPGLYHCVNDGAASWLEVAEAAAEIIGKPIHPKRLTLDTVSLKARRPRYCALSPARLAALGIVMPGWRDALRRYLS